MCFNPCNLFSYVDPFNSFAFKHPLVTTAFFATPYLVNGYLSATQCHEEEGRWFGSTTICDPTFLCNHPTISTTLNVLATATTMKAASMVENCLKGSLNCLKGGFSCCSRLAKKLCGKQD